MFRVSIYSLKLEHCQEAGGGELDLVGTGGITTRDEKMTTLVLILNYYHLKIWLM